MTSLEQLIERQRAHVTAAEQHLNADRADLDAALEMRRLARIAEAAPGVAEQRRQLAELEQRQQRRAEVIAGHAATLAAHPEAMTKISASVHQAHTELGRAATDAITALVNLWRSTQAYNTLLAEQAAALCAAGLPAEYRDGDDITKFDSGGYPTNPDGTPTWPHRALLRLDGQDWPMIPPVAALNHAQHHATAGCAYTQPWTHTDPVLAMLDAATERPRPVPAPKPARSPIPPVQGAPVNTFEGLRYDDGTVIPHRQVYRDGNGRMRDATTHEVIR